MSARIKSFSIGRRCVVLLFIMAAWVLQGIAGAQSITQSQLNALNVMNYYPSANSWPNMWTTWDPSVIDSDFALIASLHANTVRVIVNVQAFGYPNPSQTMLNELSQMVAMAASNGLQVQLTLFDWWSSYTDIVGSKTWASAVVGPYKNDSRIAFVELINEINPSNSKAMKWARTMLPYVRTIGGNIPVTVSITDGAKGGVGAELPQLISALGTAQPDFYDVHQYYDAPNEDYYQISLAQKVAAGKGLPLFVGETGQSTNAVDYTSFTFPQTQTSYEAYQDYAFRSANAATSALCLPAAAPWILWDFVPGSLTWLPSNSDQYNFGLYRVDGSAKPAAASVSSFFTGSGVDISFNNGFEEYDWDPATSSYLPLLWQVYEPNLGSFQIDTTVAHTGNASAEIYNSSSSPNGEPSFFITPIANITAGSPHTATVYVKGQNASGTTDICIAWFASGNTYISQSCGGSLSGTTSWEQISVNSVAPQNAAFAQIYLQSYNNGGAAWFDDVAFQ